jgi:hypothetical protein
MFFAKKFKIISYLGSPANILHGNGESAVDGMAATLKRGAFPSGNGRNINGKGIPRKQSMHQKLFGGGSSTPNQKVFIPYNIQKTLIQGFRVNTPTNSNEIEMPSRLESRIRDASRGIFELHIKNTDFVFLNTRQ